MALATSKVLGKKQKYSKPRSEWVFVLLLHNNQPTDEWEREPPNETMTWSLSKNGGIYAVKSCTSAI